MLHDFWKLFLNNISSGIVINKLLSKLNSIILPVIFISSKVKKKKNLFKQYTKSSHHKAQRPWVSVMELYSSYNFLVYQLENRWLTLTMIVEGLASVVRLCRQKKCDYIWNMSLCGFSKKSNLSIDTWCVL